LYSLCKDFPWTLLPIAHVVCKVLLLLPSIFAPAFGGLLLLSPRSLPSPLREAACRGLLSFSRALRLSPSDSSEKVLRIPPVRLDTVLRALVENPA